MRVQDDDIEDDDFDEDDEPVWWDVLEEKYGRELTDDELRLEIRKSYEEEFLELSEEELEADVQRAHDWRIFKEEIRVREIVRGEALLTSKEERARTKAKATEAVENLYAELCSPNIAEDDSISDEDFREWKERVTGIIRTQIDFDALLVLLKKAGQVAVSAEAKKKALKRHEENHSIRDQIYEWLDQHKTPEMALDTAADKMAGKVVPLKWRTVREHCTEWNKLRSAGRP